MQCTQAKHPKGCSRERFRNSSKQVNVLQNITSLFSVHTFWPKTPDLIWALRAKAADFLVLQNTSKKKHDNAFSSWTYISVLFGLRMSSRSSLTDWLAGWGKGRKFKFLDSIRKPAGVRAGQRGQLVVSSYQSYAKTAQPLGYGKVVTFKAFLKGQISTQPT